MRIRSFALTFGLAALWLSGCQNLVQHKQSACRTGTCGDAVKTAKAPRRAPAEAPADAVMCAKCSGKPANHPAADKTCAACSATAVKCPTCGAAKESCPNGACGKTSNVACNTCPTGACPSGACPNGACPNGTCVASTGSAGNAIIVAQPGGQPMMIVPVNGAFPTGSPVHVVQQGGVEQPAIVSPMPEGVVIAPPPSETAYGPGVQVVSSQPAVERSASIPGLPIVQDNVVTVRFGESNNYQTVVGQVFQFRRNWKVRYAALESDDKYGGSLTLVGEGLDNLKDGQMVRVQGTLIPSDDRAAGARYQVHRVDVIEPDLK